MYNYVYYIKYGGVLFFGATPKSTWADFPKQKPSIRGSAAPKKHPKSPWRLALPSPPPGHSSRGRTSLAGCTVEPLANADFITKNHGKTVNSPSKIWENMGTHGD